ncbi:hypothetical protein COO60DRAFT_1641682 [Scenedesmus sp. NREL 46B-D3]|nr:hypothetical protein COO60DRAFT_1641682 [Scenedesmus sp. NREL 46B-D3]
MSAITEAHFCIGWTGGRPSADGGDAAGQLQDDVPPAAGGSPKRRGKPVQLDQSDRTFTAASPGPVLQEATEGIAAAATAAKNAGTASGNSVLVLPAAVGGAADATAAEQLAEAGTAADVYSTLSTTAAAAAAQQDAAAMDSCAQPAAVSASSAAVLLTAAAQLQRVVEQLTQREPAVAADLSLLQWQLTAAFGSMTGAPSRSGEEDLLHHSRGSGCGQGPEADSPAAGEGASSAATTEACSSSSSSSSSVLLQDALTTAAAPVKLVPADTHPLAEEAAAAAAAGHPAQHNAAEVAAAARLFSGAATTLQAPSMDWYYLEEGGSVRGPHDAALMIRWFCSSFLEDHLPVAGVLEQADGSSRQPPAAAFQPLHVLLRQVVSISAAAGSTAIAAPQQVTSTRRQQQQQGVLDSWLSPSCKAGLLNRGHSGVFIAAAAAAAAAACGEPALPISTLSSEPAATPTGRLAVDNNAGGSSGWDSGQHVDKAAADSGRSSSNSAVDSRFKSSGGGWGIQAVQDVLGSVGSAVEGLAMQVAEGLDSLDSMANAAAAGPEAGAAATGIAAEGSSSALDFVADFPQLFPAAVMSDVVQQRHTAAGLVVQQQQQQQQQGVAPWAAGAANMKDSRSEAPAEQQQGLTAAASGAVSDMSEFAAEAVRQVRGVVAAAQLPGVWRVEGLHQMLRAVSPDPPSRTAAAAGKGRR